MCYSGMCKHEDAFGECTVYGRFDCPPEMYGPPEEELIKEEGEKVEESIENLDLTGLTPAEVFIKVMAAVSRKEKS